MKRKRFCGLCGGRLDRTSFDHVYEYSEELGPVVFEDVPVLQCTECGERWFEGNVLEAMDAVIEGKLKSPRNIEITVPAYSPKLYLKKVTV